MAWVEGQEEQAEGVGRERDLPAGPPPSRRAPDEAAKRLSAWGQVAQGF